MENVRLELLYIGPGDVCKPLHFTLHMAVVVWFEHTSDIMRLLPESKSGALPLGNTTILKFQQPLLIEERRSFILNYQASFLRAHCAFRVSLLYAAGNMRPISVVGFMWRTPQHSKLTPFGTHRLAGEFQTFWIQCPYRRLLGYGWSRKPFVAEGWGVDPHTVTSRTNKVQACAASRRS